MGNRLIDMDMIKHILHRNYLYFRFGYQNINLILSFINFTIIAYEFVIKDVSIIPIYVFGILFGLGYITLCVILGRIQLQKGFTHDNKTYFEHHKTLVKLELIKLKAMTGRASQNEIESEITYLENILYPHIMIELHNHNSYCIKCSCHLSTRYCKTHNIELCDSCSCVEINR